MNGLTTCGNCGDNVTVDSDYCPHCGILFDQAPPTACENHYDTQADGVCIICGKVLCDECLVKRNKRSFCADHCGVEVEGDGAVLCRCADPTQRTAIESRLKEESIDVFPVEQGTIFRRPYTVLMVPIPDYLRAAGILDDMTGDSGTNIKDEKGML
jgi:hypothetical protein